MSCLVASLFNKINFISRYTYTYDNKNFDKIRSIKIF